MGIVIIGITGRAGAGKDTVAEYLASTHGFVVYRFTDALWHMLLTLDPHVSHYGRTVRLSVWVEERGREQAKRTIPEIRRLLKTMGTDCIRAQRPTFWVQTLAVKWENDGCPDAVIPDVRFDNEARWIKGSPFAGDLVWHVRRRVADNVPVDHVSEAGIGRDMVDAVLTNDGTITDLHATIAATLL